MGNLLFLPREAQGRHSLEEKPEKQGTQMRHRNLGLKSSRLPNVEQMKNFRNVPGRFSASAFPALFCVLFLSSVAVTAEQPAPSLELSRSVRSWQFLPGVCLRGGLFANDASES